MGCGTDDFVLGTCGSAVCYLILTVFIYKVQVANNEYDVDRFGIGAVSIIFIFYAFFGMGWQGTAWLYNTEINSLHMRMKGAAASVAAQWAVNYMVVQITPVGIENLKWRFYLIWVFFNWCSIPILYFFYPETANRKLEDVDQLFQDGLRTFVSRDKDACSVKRPLKYVERDSTELAMATCEKGEDSFMVKSEHREAV